jgi:hypothetical protein
MLLLNTDDCTILFTHKDTEVFGKGIRVSEQMTGWQYGILTPGQNKTHCIWSEENKNMSNTM